MALSEDEVKAKVQQMLVYRGLEATRLEHIYLYLRDPDPGDFRNSARWQATRLLGPLRWLAQGVPTEIRRLAEISRVNMLRFVVNATVQSMYVDGFRKPKQTDDAEVWSVWQRNGLDARQVGVHRAGLSYGASYVTVLPGDPAPVIRGVSPRRMTVVYGDDDEWPVFALERRRSVDRTKSLYRLIDENEIYWVQVDSGMGIAPVRLNGGAMRTEHHGLGKVPVIRFLCTVDDDEEVEGEVQPLIPLQDQINITTFGLLVAQHYGAFRQRYILGWLAESEEAALKAGASKLWSFEDSEVKVGEFNQTDLKGYLESRESAVRYLATVSQTPVHELLGQLVNLSAEALAAAEATHRRKVSERQIVMGESWEQVLNLAGEILKIEPDPTAYVWWRDTEARSLSQVADALGKLVQMLGVPPKELWERVPGVSQQEVERWKAAAAEGDAFANLTAMLERQATPAETPQAT